MFHLFYQNVKIKNGPGNGIIGMKVTLQHKESLVDVSRVRTTKYGKSTFCYVAAQVWNSLPNNLRKVDDFGEFKRLIGTWSGQVFNVQI